MSEPATIEKKRTLNEWSRDDLLALPLREWDTEGAYDSLLLLSTRRKHDSGWAMMAVIGVRGDQPVEIATACSDDIEWKMPAPTLYGGGQYSIGQMRMDCAMRSGALHAWADRTKFHVGCALSSVTITAKTVSA
jgi:hypothetical protein